MKKTILITGANGGIGQCACKYFSENGYQVVGFDLIVHESNAYELFKVDLCKENEVRDTIAKVYDKYGSIDVIFNIAGGSGRRFGDGPVETCTLEGFNKTLELNLTTQFIMCKYALPYMVEKQKGCIINTASVLGMFGGGENFATHAYAAAKAGIIGMSRAMASQYAKDNIRVNVIAPGLIETPMSMRAQKNPMIMEQMKHMQPMYANKEKLGQPISIVKAAAYFADDDNDFVTGVVLPIDGGWSTI